MNAAHFHLVVNHLPIIFPIVGVIIMITGLVFKSDAVKRTAFLIFIIGSLTSIAAMTSGEGAEEVVENSSGVAENYIERHEESAELFSIMSHILGGISLFGLWAGIKQKTFANITNVLILVFAFVVIYFGKETGTTGGEIRHTEIRTNNNG
ncbi:hypothetical protein DMB65_03340 [Flavobacterium cheongpyeongense]|jgi:uncharacterized membrane protein|uniref:DUF2231 domain-containing protein n=1 Tax=Flavobacterium cheongpyeongense TaxID=2212651 RepID=A0A2V4BUE9_9FLAO|nr:hypothetical protein [Flavobacterium cheongpyeongense]PXY42277.1 hypothetical protein DMB65_03340 [Flavobacterium cheongpyeongense]